MSNYLVVYRVCGFALDITRGVLKSKDLTEE